jgi:hypothetical protein
LHRGPQTGCGPPLVPEKTDRKKPDLRAYPVSMSEQQRVFGCLNISRAIVRANRKTAGFAARLY